MFDSGISWLNYLKPGHTMARRDSPVAFIGVLINVPTGFGKTVGKLAPNNRIPHNQKKILERFLEKGKIWSLKSDKRCGTGYRTELLSATRSLHDPLHSEL